MHAIHSDHKLYSFVCLFLVIFCPYNGRTAFFLASVHTQIICMYCGRLKFWYSADINQCNMDKSSLQIRIEFLFGSVQQKSDSHTYEICLKKYKGTKPLFSAGTSFLPALGQSFPLDPPRHLLMVQWTLAVTLTMQQLALSLCLTGQPLIPSHLCCHKTSSGAHA